MKIKIHLSILWQQIRWKNTSSMSFLDVVLLLPFNFGIYWMKMDLSLNPESWQIHHLLWILFMNQYPTKGVSCEVVGGSTGRINPKTYRKWVHPFMEALSDLEPYVVVLSYSFTLLVIEFFQYYCGFN